MYYEKDTLLSVSFFVRGIVEVVGGDILAFSLHAEKVVLAASCREICAIFPSFEKYFEKTSLFY